MYEVLSHSTMRCCYFFVFFCDQTIQKICLMSVNVPWVDVLYHEPVSTAYVQYRRMNPIVHREHLDIMLLFTSNGWALEFVLCVSE